MEELLEPLDLAHDNWLTASMSSTRLIVVALGKISEVSMPANRKAATSDAIKLLSHPLVLQSAWRRVKAWYEVGEWPPTAEWVQWQMNDSGELLTLAEDLTAGTYTPAPFRLVPYPKKGGIIRHYSIPSIRDQVLFTAFGVLLAPFFEAQMPNFSFGNRWYRSLYRRYPENVLDRDQQRTLFPNYERPLNKPRWEHRPFSLSDTKAYQPYARSHGLFRRVAHWAATSMLRVADADTMATDTPKRKEDYAPGSIPPFAYQEWWQSEKAKEEIPKSLLKGYWAHLDLQLAYPSLSLNYLDEALRAHVLLERENEDLYFLDAFGASFTLIRVNSLLKGYPSSIISLLLREDVRAELTGLLVKNIKSIDYEPVPYSDDKRVEDYLWIPPHVSVDNVGRNCLPTGLLISGLLMNTALLPVDGRMARWLDSRNEAGRPAAFLRFADDMILIAQTMEDLAAGIDSLGDSLHWKPGERLSKVLADPSRGQMNLSVNWAKVKPDPLANLLKNYLLGQGWVKCTTCKLPVIPPSSEEPPSLSFADWYKAHPKNEEGEDNIEDSVLRPDRLGPFLTYLVERLSALGGDTLKNRFGNDSQEYLVQLHELVRFELQDEQVREDTRLSFAANRLARAWLRERDYQEDRNTIGQIRRSIEIALSKAPWKFGLWRAVVQTACRRPPGRADENDTADATRWLKLMLKQIEFGGETLLESGEHSDASLIWGDDHNQPGCWESAGFGLPDPATLRGARRSLKLSYLRASFWRALAQVIRDLGVLERRLSSRGEGKEVYEWKSSKWTFRAFSEKEIRPILFWLANLNRWIDILYPVVLRKKLSGSLALWWWERDAMADALVSSLSQKWILSRLSEMDLRLPCSISPNDTLNLSPSLLEDLRTGVNKGAKSDYAASILAESAIQSANIPSGWVTLFHALSDASKEELAEAAFGDRTFSLDSKRPPWKSISEGISLARAFGFLEYLPLDYVKPLVKYQTDNPMWWMKHSPLMRRMYHLEIYGSVRLLSLGLLSGKAARLQDGVSLHQLIWGSSPDPTVRNRRLQKMWSSPDLNTPERGLPTRIALAMFRDAIRVTSDRSASENSLGAIRSEHGVPGWLISKDCLSMLQLGRMAQLGYTELAPSDFPRGRRTDKPWVEIRRDSGYWTISPHPAIYLPLALELIDAHGAENDLWVHALLFYTALEGSEKSLDSVLERGPGSIPFKERWDLRSRYPIGPDIWGSIDEIVGRCGFRMNDGGEAIVVLIEKMRDHLDDLLSAPPVSLYDFLWERVDVSLDLNQSLEMPLAVLPLDSVPASHLASEELNLNGRLLEKISVRIGQLRSEPHWGNLLERFPALERSEIQSVMAEVYGSVFSGADGGGSNAPSLLIFPEVSIPRSEFRSINKIVGDSGVAIFCGLIWRIIPRAIKYARNLKPLRRFFINEGLLSVPLRFGGDTDGPLLVRNFIIEKPIPATVERGLAKALGEYGNEPRVQWKILPGRRWFRFVHPLWGDFTVAICSDLLDASPWVALRGSILHLFMCAYNNDVELYEALTWIRAYENYVNMVSVNHGKVGGSFAWSPRHGEKKELAKLRGGDLLITADVVLPVRELWKQQQVGLEESVCREAQKWLEFARKSSLTEKEEKPEKMSKRGQWKTPPPEFPSRDRQDDKG